MINIKRINNKQERAKIVRDILCKLKPWFEDEKAVDDYVENVQDEMVKFWGAFSEERCVGFLSVIEHYNRAGEIYVCGVEQKYAGQGIGTKLCKTAEEHLILQDFDYMIVKTLSEKSAYEPYSKTRHFYEKMGFVPLITLNEIWDKDNPCLIMIKNLK